MSYLPVREANQFDNMFPLLHCEKRCKINWDLYDSLLIKEFNNNTPWVRIADKIGNISDVGVKIRIGLKISIPGWRNWQPRLTVNQVSLRRGSSNLSPGANI
tara:strand:- start:2076 stop:2381 length:306 start_codon:yes stop_codon:yes gene_type:complete